jgi:uncharacterized Zn-finger protein
MGPGNRLHGKPNKLSPGQLPICPKCGREFFEHKLVKRGGKVIKTCPYCSYEFKQ